MVFTEYYFRIHFYKLTTIELSWHDIFILKLPRLSGPNRETFALCFVIRYRYAIQSKALVVFPMWLEGMYIILVYNILSKRNNPAQYFRCFSRRVCACMWDRVSISKGYRLANQRDMPWHCVSVTADDRLRSNRIRSFTRLPQDKFIQSSTFIVIPLFINRTQPCFS